MTREEIIDAILNDPLTPYMQEHELENIVDFVIKNYKPELPEGLDEAAEEFAHLFDQGTCNGIAQECFKAGAEWMAGQGVSVNGVFGIRGVESNNIVDAMLDGGLKMGDKVIVQIRKK